MNSAFVAQWFDDQDRSLVAEIDRILYSHGILPMTGDHTGGMQLEEGVKKRIDESDSLIALATRRTQVGNDEWQTHPWVINEYGYALAQRKSAIAIVEQGVRWEGMYAGREHIRLDRQKASDALLRLSITIGVWKEDAGESWTLQILPDTLAERIEEEAANCDCQFRTVERGRYSDWQPVSPVTEAGGVFLYVNGVKEQQKIEVKVATNQGRWKSPATPRWMPVELREMR